MHSRRWLLKNGALCSLTLGTAPAFGTPVPQRPSDPGTGTQLPSKWARGIEGQRKADLGNGRFLNPILPGDRPNPTILKDGADYYITFSTSESNPELVIWHSQDLVNWTPLVSAMPDRLPTPVLAVDLSKHDRRYYIYIPSGGNNYVIHADNIRGPWSKPVPLNVRGIDPGHIAGEDGKRYLFLSGGNRVTLTDDGLATAGPVTKVYDGWKYPDDWVVEAFSLESPKLFRRGDYFYLVCAEGGSFGPPTGHMATVARSRSVNGPWENSPHNPIVRTQSDAEPWRSRGHATIFEGPAGDWWMVYHAFEKGFVPLGRQTLLEPITWTPAGWPRASGGDASGPMAKPRGGRPSQHGVPLSDDFTDNRFGRQWNFFAPAPDEAARVKYVDGALVLAGKGSSPSDSSPIACVVGDHAYEVSVELEVPPQVVGGLLLFQDRNLHFGIGHDGTRRMLYRGARGGGPVGQPESAPIRRIFLKIQNDRHIVSFYFSGDGKIWERHDLRVEASAYIRGVGSSESLRPALFATGQGEVKFRQFRYRAL